MSRIRPPIILALFFALMTATFAQAQVCGDGLWPDGEFCGQDAYVVTGDTDMNHDCEVDFLDVALFFPYFLGTTTGPSADFNNDGVVNITDVAFLGNSLSTGNPVTPCNPSPGYPDSCGSTLCLSLDPGTIVSRGRASAPTLVSVYVVADDWVDAEAIEFGYTFSSNLTGPNSSSPAGWTGMIEDNNGNAFYESWFGSSLTGTTTVVQLDFWLWDSAPAWVRLDDYSPSTDLLNRWAPSIMDRRTEFQVRRHVGINGIDPVSVTACPSANSPPTLVMVDPAGPITVPWSTATYDLAGTAVDTEGPVSFVEVRVNNGTWQTAAGTASWTHQIPLIVGENWVQVRCADPTGAYSQTHVEAITRLERPDLMITSWSVSPDTLDHGCSSTSISVTVENIGADASPATRLGFYLSSDAVISVSDTFLTYGTIVALGVGATQTLNGWISIPDDGPRGSVYLGAFVDDLNAVNETNEGNNTASSAFEIPPPIITTVADVGNDQGRNVRINLLASPRDALGSPTPILQYEFFRRIDPLPLKAATPSGAVPGLGGAQVSDPAKLAGWEFVGAVPAHGSAQYNAIVPTLADSTTAGIHWSIFFVRAATSQPPTFFDSCPDSGYSVDDLPPSVPLGLKVAYAAAGNQLEWDENLEDDFRYYRVYRGNDSGFVPDVGNLVEATTATEWLDTASDPWSRFYKITAVDQSGNESAVAVPLEITGTQGPPPGPTRYALHQCAPNPFNPMTLITFDLPEPAFVKLRVYSTDGRLVTTLVERAMPAGTHDAIWHGRDGQGRPAAAGVYFYRLDAGEFTQTRRMVLIN